MQNNYTTGAGRNDDFRVPTALVEKYNVQAPRYTSYPPANFFKDDFSVTDYLSAIERSNNEKPDNISIYIHIPFCNQLCLYCGCNTHITKDKSLVASYVAALKKEITIIGRLLDPRRKVSQIHWGGGTPNTLDANIIGEVINLLTSMFSFTDNPEIAVECNPAYLDETYIARLGSFGFNRISMGVQDFDMRVLKAVNREVPAIPVSELCDMIRSHSGMSVNLDFIYGLPYQSEESFTRTIDQAVAIAPERLVTFSYAHVPWVKSYQKKLEQYALPGPGEKIKMFESAWRLLGSAGYTAIGLDHYAIPDDELSKALKRRTLHRNFQGYCTRETTGQVYAFGITGISQLTSVYSQNTKSVTDYITALNNGKMPVIKGYSLMENEKLARHAISEIMCNRFLSWHDMASSFGLTVPMVKAALGFVNEKLGGFLADGLVDYNDNEIIVSEVGRFFLRNIATVFDIYNGCDGQYSTVV